MKGEGGESSSMENESSFGVLSLLHRAIRLKPSVEVSTRPDGLSSQLKGGGSALDKISELLLSLVS